MRHIFLVGFMGSGKSTIGKELSALLSMPFWDTDQEIEKEAGTSVSEIFEQKGEPAFRAMERTILLTLVNREVPSIIATGGGMFTSAENRQVIEASGTSFYIKRRFRQLYRTIRNDEARPLAVNKAKKELYLLFKQRQKIYRKAQFVIFNLHHPSQTARKIYNCIHILESGD